MTSDLKKLDIFTLETSKNHLIRNFLRNGRLGVYFSAGGAYIWVRMTLFYLDKKFLKFTSAYFTESQIDQATR